MSDLQPKGIPIVIGDVERHLLFTISVIDEIQAKYEKPLSSVMEMLQDDDKLVHVVFDLMYFMINDEIDRERFFRGKEEEHVTEQALKYMMDYAHMDEYMGAIFRAYGVSLPEAEDNSPNAESRSD